MTTNKTAKAALLIVGASALLFMGYISLRFFGVIAPGACISEDARPLASVSGANVEVIYTNCDSLTKDEAVSVYVSTAAQRTRLRKWLEEDKTLIFRYDPGRPNNLPVITSPAKDTIVISISDVSSIAVQRRRWGNMSIAYKIGRVEYR